MYCQSECIHLPNSQQLQKPSCAVDRHDISHRSPTRSGFTLVELLTVIAVTCIVATVAIPSFLKLTQTNRLTSESHALLALMALGRSEAIKRIQQVILCKSKDGTTCTETSGSDWTQGMILFADANGDRILNASDSVIRRETSPGPATSISFNTGNVLIYRANGTSSGGTFTISSGNIQKKVVVSLAGRARVE